MILRQNVIRAIVLNITTVYIFRNVVIVIHTIIADIIVINVSLIIVYFANLYQSPHVFVQKIINFKIFSENTTGVWFVIFVELKISKNETEKDVMNAIWMFVLLARIISMKNKLNVWEWKFWMSKFFRVWKKILILM